MAQCTWKFKDQPRCDQAAAHDQVATDGQVWAKLCSAHHALLESVIGKDTRKMLGYWVAAQGGVEAATARMIGPRCKNGDGRIPVQDGLCQRCVDEYWRLVDILS